MPTEPERHAGVAGVDLTGRTAVVTGSTSGIGREIALSLGRLGATVVVHGRDEQRGRAVVEEITDAGGKATFEPADFASLSAVRSFADGVRSATSEVDVLLNNAGGLFRSGDVTADGIERTFAVNHAAPFLLTRCLLPAMPADGRVVTTASDAHRSGRLEFDALRTVEDYSAFGAYSRSKLANVLFTRELARRSDVRASCFHPGFVPGSEFFRQLPAPIRLPMRAASAVPGFGTSVERGAETGVYLAAAPDVDASGGYFSRRDRTEPAAAARDDDTARRLWTVSEELVGLEESLRLSADRAEPAD